MRLIIFFLFLSVNLFSQRANTIKFKTQIQRCLDSNGDPVEGCFAVSNAQGKFQTTFISDVLDILMTESQSAVDSIYTNAAGDTLFVVFFNAPTIAFKAVGLNGHFSLSNNLKFIPANFIANLTNTGAQGCNLTYQGLTTPVEIRMHQQTSGVASGTRYTSINSGTGAGNGFFVGAANSEGILLNYENTDIDFYTNSLQRLTLQQDGQFDMLENIRVFKGLKDVNNSLGTSGQVLSTTGTTVDWVDSGTVDTFAILSTYNREYRKRFYDFYEDFQSSSSTNPTTLIRLTTGTGSLSSGVTNVGNIVGVMKASTVSGTTSTIGMHTHSESMVMGEGTWTYELNIMGFNIYSDATQTFQFFAGFWDGGTSMNGTDMVGFVYDSTGVLVGGNASDKWQMVMSNLGTPVYVETDVFFDPEVETRLRFELNADATSCEYFINDSSVGTMSEQVVTVGGAECSFGFLLKKSAGTDAALVNIDYLSVQSEFTTPK